MQLVFRLDPAVVYNFVPSPPKARLILSTYFINSNADFFPIYSKSVPPKSLVILYFPSENAPAPEKPHVMLQNGLHFTHSFSVLSGHFRSSTRFPCSIRRILFPGFFLSISYAKNAPAGPPPTTIKS